MQSLLSSPGPKACSLTISGTQTEVFLGSHPSWAPQPANSSSPSAHHFIAMTWLLPPYNEQNQGSPSQQPESSLCSLTSSVPGGYNQSSAAGESMPHLQQRGAKDGSSWSTTAEKQLNWVGSLNTPTSRAQHPYFHLSFPFLRKILEVYGLQQLQKLLQYWCLQLLMPLHQLVLGPSGLHADSRKSDPCSVKISSTRTPT